MTSAYPVDGSMPSPEPSQADIRADLRAGALQKLAELRASVEDPTFDKTTLCGQLFPDDEAGILEYVRAYGFPNELRSLMEDSPTWFGSVNLWCFLPDYPDKSRSR